MNIIQIISKIIVMIIMIPIGLAVSLIMIPLAIIGLPLWILLALADGESIIEAFECAKEVALIGFDIIFDR